MHKNGSKTTSIFGYLLCSMFCFMPSSRFALSLCTVLNSYVLFCACVVMSWVLVSWRTYQGTQWDRLHYGSNEICQSRLHSGAAWLSVQQHLPQTTGDTVELDHLNRYVDMCVCEVNYTLMNKACCCVAPPHPSGFKLKLQTETV